MLESVGVSGAQQQSMNQTVGLGQLHKCQARLILGFMLDQTSNIKVAVTHDSVAARSNIRRVRE